MVIIRSVSDRNNRNRLKRLFFLLVWLFLPFQSHAQTALFPASVQFDFNQTTLRSETKEKLEEISRSLLDHPEMTASIAGYTDSMGGEAYNLALGMRRALAVKAYLIRLGIYPLRLMVTSHGEGVFFCREKTRDCSQKNRRVEIILLTPPQVMPLQVVPEEKVAQTQQEEIQSKSEDIPLPIPQEPPCFIIRQIVLEGETSSYFASALRDAQSTLSTDTGRCLGILGIQEIIKSIQNAIVARGYVTTRIMTPEQDLKTGLLKLIVVPGKIRSIRFTNPSRARWFNAVPTRPGELLNLRDIEQGLENFHRIPTVQADIQIVPGEQPGESDLVIVWQQKKRMRLSLNIDDSGSAATGKYQGSLTLTLDHPLTLNDLFYVTVNRGLEGRAAFGTDGWSTHYSLPFGYWLIAVTGGKSSYYQAVAGANQTYIYRGISANEELSVSRLVYRNATRKITSVPSAVCPPIQKLY